MCTNAYIHNYRYRESIDAKLLMKWAVEVCVCGYAELHSVFN